jgi:hypothetical protein
MTENVRSHVNLAVGLVGCCTRDYSVTAFGEQDWTVSSQNHCPEYSFNTYIFKAGHESVVIFGFGYGGVGCCWLLLLLVVVSLSFF